MDIQVNKGPAALHYLAKYLTKLDDDAEFRLEVVGAINVTVDDHMKARIVGSIEAAYDLLSLHHHQKSREVVYIPMNLPYDQSRGIRPDLRDTSIPGSSRQVFAKTLVDHYEARTGDTAVQSLLLPDFVKFYYPCSTPTEKKEYERRAKENQMEFQDEYGQLLPLAIISDNMVFRLRKSKCRFWRTRLVSAMSDSEAFYYQQILTNIPVYGRTFVAFKNDSLRTSPNDHRVFSWRDFYQYLVQNDMLHTSITIPDDVAEYNMQVANTPLLSAQQSIFDLITDQIL